MPSNTCCLAGLTQDVVAKKLLGDDVQVEIHMLDENVDEVPVEQICELQGGAQVIVGLVGVQTNQFPRAADLAREFRRAGVTVMIGGFHVSGCLAMLKEMTALVRTQRDAGKTLEQLKAAGVPEKYKSWGNFFIKGEMFLEMLYKGLPPTQKAATPAAPTTPPGKK